MNDYKVYKHTAPNGKIYIGITKNTLKQRAGKEGKGYINNKYFYNAIKKYGWDNIKHEILYDGLEETQAKLMEISLIHYHKSNDPEYGYNITAGGEGGFGNHKPKTEEHRLNLSKAGKEKHPHTGSNNPMYNKHQSEETKKKISDSKKGSKAWNKGLSGFKMSPESIENSRKAHFKPIIDDMGNIFESRLACAEYYKHTPTWVATRLKDGRFKYVA